MIRVTLMGHIGTSVGKGEVVFEEKELMAEEIIERLRRMSSGVPGFTRYNTLVMISDSDAFVPASGDRRVRSGESVVLIPFSHGG
jgi:molybdopterin converting factor small subunit